MEKIEPVVRKWYDYLEEGKFTALKCKHCGHYEYPPVPICNECGRSEMEWVELSGEGTLNTVSVDNMPRTGFEKFGLLVSGYVRLKEGPDFVAWITNVDSDDRDSLFDRIPLPVEVDIIQHEGYKYPAFKLKK